MRSSSVPPTFPRNKQDPPICNQQPWSHSTSITTVLLHLAGRTDPVRYNPRICVASAVLPYFQNFIGFRTYAGPLLPGLHTETESARERERESWSAEPTLLLRLNALSCLILFFFSGDAALTPSAVACLFSVACTLVGGNMWSQWQRTK